MLAVGNVAVGASHGFNFSAASSRLSGNPRQRQVGPHRLRNQSYVVVVDFKSAKAKLEAPALAVFNELELIQQRQDGCFLRGHKRHVTAAECKAIAHVEHTGLASLHDADRDKAL